MISILAPRAGRDVVFRRDIDYEEYISILAPRAGRDSATYSAPTTISAFQSSRPVRGATLTDDNVLWAFKISILAPRAGRDRCNLLPCFLRSDFNPRAPCGARHVWGVGLWIRYNFNPRAPCGARHTSSTKIQVLGDFNPRAPCGARQN